MINLISAGIRRYLTNIFYIAALGVIALMGIMTGILLREDLGLEPPFLIIAAVSGIIAAVTSGSGEFGNGINKNKLICGHTRATIYISEYMISLILSLSLLADFMLFCLPFCPKAIKRLGGEWWFVLGAIILIMLAYTAIFHAAVNIVPYRAAAAVVIALLVGLASVYFADRLENISTQPEYFEFTYFNEETLNYELQKIKNDNYIPHDTLQYRAINATYLLDPGAYIYRYYNLYAEVLSRGSEHIEIPVFWYYYNTDDPQVIFNAYKDEVMWLFVTTGLFLGIGWLCFFKRNLK